MNDATDPESHAIRRLEHDLQIVFTHSEERRGLRETHERATTESTDARIDVALHAPGGVVWVADVFNGAWTASVSPPGTDGLDTGLQSALAARPVACGCTSTPVPPSLILGWIWMGWLRRRDP